MNYMCNFFFWRWVKKKLQKPAYHTIKSASYCSVHHQLLLTIVSPCVDSFWPVNGNVLSTKTGSIYRVVEAYGRTCPSVWPDRNPRNGSFRLGLGSILAAWIVQMLPQLPLERKKSSSPRGKRFCRGINRGRQNRVAFCQVLGTDVWNA